MGPPFLGRWNCTIDGKRRLTLPAKVREILEMEKNPGLVMTLGQGGCLFVVPQNTWDELTPDLLRDPFHSDKKAAKLRSSFARYGSFNRLDSSGRITLTDDQMFIGGLSKQAIVFGNFTTIEIWDPARFETSNPPIGNTDEHDELLVEYMGGGSR